MTKSKNEKVTKSINDDNGKINLTNYWFSYNMEPWIHEEYLKGTERIYKIMKKLLSLLLIISVLISMGMTNVYADGDDSDHTVTVIAANEDKEAEVGNITVEGEQAGLYVSATGEHTADVMTGNISSEATGAVIGAAAGGETNVETGNIEAEIGATIIAAYEGSVNLATGNIVSETAGIALQSHIDSDVDLMTGDIKAGTSGVDAIVKESCSTVTTGNIEASFTGLYARTTDGGFEATVNGNISSGNGVGAIIESDEGSFSEATVNGNIDAMLVGAIAQAEQGSVSLVTVNGNITSGTGSELAAYGESYVLLEVDGNIEADDEGIFMIVKDESEASFIVNGNISGETGILINGDQNSVADGLVDGMIDADLGIGVERNGEFTNVENFDLTVWKIELSKKGTVAESFTAEYKDGELTKSGYEELEDFEKNNIHYIIKLEQPAAGATLKATDRFGNDLQKSYDREVANEDEVVYLKINLEDGYRLTGAYNGKGEKQALLKDDHGSYYIATPRGGGVYLSVELEKISASSDDNNRSASVETEIVQAEIPVAAVHAKAVKKNDTVEAETKVEEKNRRKG